MMRLLAFVFFVLFFLTVKCQCTFYSKLNFPKNRCLGTSPGSAGIRHIGAPNDLIVFIVFPQFGVIS